MAALAAVQATVAPAAAAAVVAGSEFANSSLYVGDLDNSVNENQLYEVFSQIAQVVSIRVCRDQNRRSSLGYAYVNYTNPIDAATAMETLNFTPLNGKPIRIMFSHRDPNIRKSGRANVFIKNLDASIDNKALLDTFSVFGNVLSCKIALDANGQSRGFGFVQFEDEESAANAINKLNGMLLNDKQVYVGAFVRRQERTRLNGMPVFTNVYVKNLPETTSDEDLRKIFGAYGMITSAVVMRDQNGKSRCFGFVNFESHDAAATAVEKLDSTMLNNEKVLYVGRAQTKAEREAELRAKFELEKITRYEKLQRTNLYLKNLDETVNDEKLRELFSEFGNITSCKVMVDSHDVSKGSGFVAFSTPEEASKALNEMNGKMVGRKPLYVAVAQRKDERRARLQAHFSQAKAPNRLSPLQSGLPGFHLGGPRLSAHQQLYLSQAAPPFMPPQPPTGYGFHQQQLMPGIRPRVSGPNFMMPYPLQRQAHPAEQIGLRRGTHQMQQQPLQRSSNQGLRYVAGGRNGMEPSPSVVSQGRISPMMPMSLDVSGMAMPLGEPQHQATPISISTLSSALASAVPSDRTFMLGEQLYPLVESVEPNHAGKLTGMLLEMDQTEVLRLIESPDALKKKVAEAMDVLRQSTTAAGGGAAAATATVEDKLSALGLNA